MSWAYKVVKQMRGADGRFFDFQTAATFETREQACEYAEEFARDQATAGVTGALIVVRGRRRDADGAVYRSDDYRIPSKLANGPLG